jgi:hypothetical protein
MKIAELFKHMIDLLDQEEQAQSQEITPDEPGVMVPPLQQKIEMLKKSQGIENVYDEEPDELAHIKRNAGIISVVTAEEDEPFEG